MLRFLIAISVFVFSTVGTAQQVAKSEYGKFLLKNATIHTVTDGIISSGDVLIDNGLIAQMGADLTVEDAIIIDCSGAHIYPGFIDAGSRVGLSEVGAVSLTNDYNEIGDIIPQMQALTAVNPNSVAIPVTRVNGVTSALVVPTGGSFPGTAALINLHGYTPAQMYGGFKGIAMNFPTTGRRSRRDRRSTEDIKKAEEKAMKTISDTWEQLELYAKMDSAARAQGTTLSTYKPELQALLPVINKEVVLLIEVNKDNDIKTALKWVKDKDIRAILTGVAEGWKVAEEIASAGIPVITGPVLSNPRRSEDRYDIAYKNAGIMQKAGVKVALRTNDSENVRNLPFNAGFAATYGMGKEEALKSITINPAEIFEVQDRYGSITVGKVANLFVSTGDPFEMKSRITHLFISGWKVPIESRHTLLYDEFLKRSPGLD